MQDQTATDGVVEFVDPEDVHAGKMLGTVLTLFFVYTLVVVPYVIWWTLESIKTSPFQ